MRYMIIHALIPARSGSKSIPNKNIQKLGDKPLLAYSIEIALQSKFINKVIVSTDSEEYKLIAENYGADVPFLRPSDISGDSSTDLEFMLHYLEWSESNSCKPDVIVHLRPTFPNRNLDDLNKCIEMLMDKWDEYDSLRSVILSQKSPYKMYQITENNLVPLYYSVNGLKEPYNLGRQQLPNTYLHNGCIDIVKTSVIEEMNSVSGKRILPYVMSSENDGDIDYWDDFKREEKRICG